MHYMHDARLICQRFVHRTLKTFFFCLTNSWNLRFITHWNYLSIEEENLKFVIFVRISKNSESFFLWIWTSFQNNKVIGHNKYFIWYFHKYIWILENKSFLILINNWSNWNNLSRNITSKIHLNSKISTLF